MTCEVIKGSRLKRQGPAATRAVSHPENSPLRAHAHIDIEFVHLTHSIPQTVGIIVHTNTERSRTLTTSSSMCDPTLWARNRT